MPLKNLKRLTKTLILLELNAAIVKMDELGAWDFDAKVKQILGKLNIHHLQQPVKYIKRWTAKKSSTCKNID